MDYVEIFVEVKRETELAYLCSDGVDEFWLPKSQIKVEWSKAQPRHATILIPEWLAMDKEII